MGILNDEREGTMDIVRSNREDNEMSKLHLTAEKLFDILQGLPSDCKILVQQIDEDYKDSWSDSKYYIINTDSSLVGEYWQAWDAYYNEDENLLLIHLHY